MTHLMQNTPILCATLAPPGHFCIHIFSFFYNGTAILGSLLASTHTLYCLKTDRRLVDRGRRRRMHRAMFSKICLVWEEMRNVWRGEGGLPLGCQRETRNDGFVA